MRNSVIEIYLIQKYTIVTESPRYPNQFAVHTSTQPSSVRFLSTIYFEKEHYIYVYKVVMRLTGRRLQK